MSRAVAYRHADWLSLVEPTGGFLTIPVLNRAFPNGLDRVAIDTRAQVRAGMLGDLRDPATATPWIDWVLGDLLGWGARLRSGPQVPATLTHVVGEHHAVLRPDDVLVEPDGDSENPRALVCRWPLGTDLHAKLPGDRWSAGAVERMSLLCRATGVPVGVVTDGNEWVLVWSPTDASPGTARFFASLFSEEPALLDAFWSLLGAKRFFSVAPSDTLEALLRESATAQEVVADQLGRQVRAAVEMLIAAISRANRERDGALLAGHTETEIYTAAVTVMMRLVFLLFAEERGLLPLDDDLYARSYALSTLRDSLQAERDLNGEEPLERRATAWTRILALFRAVHGGTTHEDLRIPPYGGRLFDPNRFPFLEGRSSGVAWRHAESHPIPVDDLTVLAMLTQLQVLEFREGGVREARLLSYRTLEVEQIGHVYEGLLDHSVRVVTETTVGLVGKAGDEPEVPLVELETHAALGRDELIAWLRPITGKTQSQLVKLLDAEPSDADRQLLIVAVENDTALSERLMPYVALLRRDLRELPIVLLSGSVVVTQTSARRDGGIEYTTRSLADEVAEYALQPLVYSPGPQDTADSEHWRLRSSDEILDLKICDPAVGSGAILVAAGRYLADRLVEAWDTEGAPEAAATPEEVLVTARRAIADRCLYGVDRDPLAAEMAKLSLWLTTMSKDRPFTFLDHAIRVGDALLGVTDLEQVRWMHLDPSKGRKIHTNLFDYTAVLEPFLKDALERRQRLADIRVVTIRDADDKARLTSEADADLEALRVVADLVVAAHVATSTQKASALDARLLRAAEKVSAALGTPGGLAQHAAALADVRATAAEWLNAERPETAPVRSCLHWPLEFPEVFVDREQPGFDAMVGNPPFIGGKKISGAAGSDLREHLVRAVAGGTKGNADLVAYFFLRATVVARSFGLIATNTIAQGDTSEVGLTRIVDAGWSIHRAVSSTPWPGQASLEIAKVWAASWNWGGVAVLDGSTVASGIDEMLYPFSRSRWRKQRLMATEGQAFIGANINGVGFLLEPEEMAELVLADPSSRHHLSEFLSGEDLNQRSDMSPSRFVINFDRAPIEEARRHPDLLRIVEERVRPHRMKLPPSKARVRDHWWQFEFTAPALRKALTGLTHCIVIAQTSKTLVPARINIADRELVCGHTTVVFAYDDFFHLGVMNSEIHRIWVLRHAAWMKTDPRYIPGDCFDTFVQPPSSGDVSAKAEVLDSHLRSVMLSAGAGLTKTYNRVHDASDVADDVALLRQHHRALDQAVIDAYGWADLDLQHGFYPVRGQGTRFTFAPAVAEEILERLLELNKERYEAEVAAGLHAAPAKGAAKKAARKTPAAKKSSAPSLFGDDEDASDELGDDE